MFLTPEELQRRREERRQRIKKVERKQIYFPLAGAFIVIVALAVLIWALPGDAGNNIIVFLLFLCPMAVFLYAVYVALALTLIYSNKGNALGFKGLEKLNNLAEQIRYVAVNASRRVNQQSVRFNSALAPATDLMNKVVEPERRPTPAAKTETDKSDGSTLPR